MHVKVLGTGCRKCVKLHEVAEHAIAAAGLEVTLEKVEDIDSIIAYRVMATPALVIDDQVVVSGRIPKTDEVVAWLQAAAQAPRSQVKP